MAEYWDTALEWKRWFFTLMYLPVFLVLLVFFFFVTTCTGRQTGTVERLAGGLTLIRSRSSYNHTFQHAYLCVYVYICSFFLFWVYHTSWLSNSLYLLDTGIFVCPATGCRPCQPAFLPGFHRLGECACFSWLSTEILCLSESVNVLSFLDMYLPVFLVLLVFVCVCVCVTVNGCAPADKQTK